MVRVAALTQTRFDHRSASEHRDHVLEVLGRLSSFGPDIVCLPEAFTAKGVPAKSVAAVAEALDGETIGALAESARALKSHIVCPIYLRRGELFWNAAILIDRSGEIRGIYEKRRPVSSGDQEFELGVQVGAGEGCFDLDFGRVAIRICMDANYPEEWSDLADKDVRLVFWPSALSGTAKIQAYALLHHYYVVSAVRTGAARVIDPLGSIVAESAPAEDFVTAEINLDFVVGSTETDPRAPFEIARKYGARAKVLRRAEEGLFLLEMDPSLSAQSVFRELGLVSRRRSLLLLGERHKRPRDS